LLCRRFASSRGGGARIEKRLSMEWPLPWRFRTRVRLPPPPPF
jgi:hypothetical protein